MKPLQIEYIARELGLDIPVIRQTLQLLQDGATLPFIARYRKEVTGNMDEVQIGKIKSLREKMMEADKRREGILQAIQEQGKLTDDLRKALEQAMFINDLEDLYLPYKQKRKTKASVAIERGLEPLARLIFYARASGLAAAARRYLSTDVPTTDEALQGARDIIAEWISEDLKARQKIRYFYQKFAVLTARLKKGKETEGIKYRDYFEYSEKLSRMPSHRILAVMRAANEDILRIKIDIEDDEALEALKRLYAGGSAEANVHVALAAEDSYKRLLRPSIENEYYALAKERADAEAVQIFASNLHQLLLAPPLGQVPVLAIDPGFRTGSKIAVLDDTGALCENTVIYIQEKKQEAAAVIRSLLDKYAIKDIAIGNGTASRETSDFIRNLALPHINVYMVSEQGASVYSASDIAREEFPDKDITVRGAVSIGRRLMDPLAELVKLDPKTIGVGQYQHDVDQKLLKQNLDGVVESCVNKVGVELNTASKSLLSYVSGLGPVLAQNIIDYRERNGKFRSRHELKKVKRLGEKAFEQCAGFLRISDAENPLDRSAVHPESYYIVEKMARDGQKKITEMMESREWIKQVDLKKYITDTVGLPTLRDIVAELEKPGRDPRPQLSTSEFAQVREIQDLRSGMKLPGVVTNITAFGCFVDIGVHQDGLVHLSKLARQYVRDPSQIVKLHQSVEVTVLEVDVERRRITLSMVE